MEDDEDEEDDDDDILEEDDGEFNDIIDDKGVAVGEEWLVNKFIISEAQGHEQFKTIMDLYQKDKKKSSNNQHNASIRHHSPY